MEPRAPTRPVEPNESERGRHELTHLLAAPWCLDCLRGKSQAKPHFRVHWSKRDEQPPLVAIDFMFMKSDSTLAEAPADAWATTLVASDEATGMCLAVTLGSKMASNKYMHESLVFFIDKVLRQRKMILQHDGGAGHLSGCRLREVEA